MLVRSSLTELGSLGSYTCVFAFQLWDLPFLWHRVLACEPGSVAPTSQHILNKSIQGKGSRQSQMNVVTMRTEATVAAAGWPMMMVGTRTAAMAKTTAVELMMVSDGCGEGHGDDEVNRNDGDGNDNGDCDANLHCPLGWTESPGRYMPEGVHEHVSRGDEGIHALDVGITVSWAMCHIG